MTDHITVAPSGSTAAPRMHLAKAANLGLQESSIRVTRDVGCNTPVVHLFKASVQAHWVPLHVELLLGVLLLVMN